MITFHYVRYKNFLSSGNNRIEIQLDDAKTTLVVGHNGSGKTTMIDAISYALFGRGYRSVNKPQLINSVNQKDCVVELEFSTNGQYYKIVRGMRPAVFEIYKNGHLLNQDAKARDYQALLEQNILGLNHRTFHQVVILGSSSYIPFMKLPAGARRQVIEDILDINVFSKMTVACKGRHGNVKRELREVDDEVTLTKEKIELKKDYIRQLQKMNDGARDRIGTKIGELHEELKVIRSDIAELESDEFDPSTVKEYKATLRSELDEMTGYKREFTSKVRTKIKDNKFYAENNVCPTCSQGIDEQFKEFATRKNDEKILELKTALDQISEKEDELGSKLSEADKRIAEYADMQAKIRGKKTIGANIVKQVKELKAELTETSASSDEVTRANSELSELIETRDELSNRKAELYNELQYYNAVNEMLKDGGIKTKVIKKYLPHMNAFINDYLNAFDFFVLFHIDETFSEVIKSRYRDSFSYDSFSEGEKQKIDLSILFAWRQIAKMKNSVATNLLIMDETFDASLDAEGTEVLTNIIRTFDDGTNAIIISHKSEVMDGKFERKLTFRKNGNFSELME